MLANMLRIECLEIAIMRLMEVDQDCHHFVHTQPRGWPALAPDAQQLGILRSRQPLTEIIDGSSRLRIWWSIVLPLAKPALATVAIFSFMFAWNDFTGPLIFLNSREKFTLSPGLQAFMFERRTMWGPLMAASTMMIMPILIVFFLAQKHFIQGIALTGIKA